MGLFWIQEDAGKEKLTFEKVKGQDHPADIMTKNISPRLLERHGRKVSLMRREGRAKEGLQVQGG